MAGVLTEHVLLYRKRIVPVVAPSVCYATTSNRAWERSKNRTYSVSALSVFMTLVTKDNLLYSTLLCKKIARAPGGQKYL